MRSSALKHLVASVVVFASVVAKSDLLTSCMSEGANGDIKGSAQMNQSLPIASVSKVFTSLWAAERLKLDYRFPTQVYLTQLSDGSYNVHLRGSLFPYFDRSMLYFLLGELNKRDVKAINELTFDENFEYASLVRAKSKLIHQDGEQTEADIIKELSADITNLPKQYNAYLQTTQALVNIMLPKTVRMSVKKVSLQSMSVFDAGKATSTFMLRSSELHRTLKELNRNSHNFAAQKIFERLSRTEKFEDYMTSMVGVGSSEFSFVNGSGYPKLIEETKDGAVITNKVYNSATCRTVVAVIQRLNQVATQQGKDLQYLLPIAGSDAAADGNSTVTTLYLTEGTQNSLLAKTGTITPSVSLAGTALTKQGVVFFHVSSAGVDYDSIRTFLANLISSHGGSEPLQTPLARPFLPFDENSIQEAK